MSTRCKKCILPDTFPGVKLDRKGICNYCNTNAYACNWNSRTGNMSSGFSNPEEARNDFFALIERLRKREDSYNCILELSGGKDSVYMLHQLVEMRLRPLAVTIDNGFINQAALENSKYAAKKLGVDHIIVSPAVAEDIIEKSLKNLPRGVFTRFFICTNCICLTWSVLIKEAINRGIPAVFIALTPIERFMGYYEVPEELITGKGFMPDTPSNNSIFDRAEESYFFNPKNFPGAEFPRVIFPYHITGYPGSPEKVKKEVLKLELTPSGKVRTETTNCPLTKFMPYIDIFKDSYYTWEDRWSEKVRRKETSKLKALTAMATVRALIRLRLLWRKEKKYCMKKLNLSSEELKRLRG